MSRIGPHAPRAALLVGLGVVQRGGQAGTRELETVDIQSNGLGAAEAAGEAHQQGAIAQTNAQGGQFQDAADWFTTRA
jgi:hypothetical protein